MCGRYALGIRAAFVRYQLRQQNIPVDEFPEDNEARETFNFAPGYYGLVYRLDPPTGQQDGTTDLTDNGNDQPSNAASPTNASTVKHKLQAMKWGLIPFWTKRNPDYGTLMRTINCRDDSLEENRGMWTSMKKTKRCVVIAQGFFEWLKKNDGKEKVPHFVKRKDGKLMLMAGLWDCVRYEDSEQDLYTYTIITTENNKQLSFLHDRMPVILEANSKQMWDWLDPGRTEWSNELQSILQPYKDDLECYAVSKEVGKVGNNSPNFIVPVASAANKQNIANFFNAQKENKQSKTSAIAADGSIEMPSQVPKLKTESKEDLEETLPQQTKAGDLKRTAGTTSPNSPDRKSAKLDHSPPKIRSPLQGKKARDATSNGFRAKVSPSKPDASQSKKITNFFTKT